MKKIMVEMEEKEYLDFYNWGNNTEKASKLRNQKAMEEMSKTLTEKISIEQHKIAVDSLAEIEGEFMKKHSRIKGFLVMVSTFAFLSTGTLIYIFIVGI